MEIITVSDEIIEINVTEEVVNIVTQTGAYPLPSNVFSVFNRVGNVVGQAGDYTTSLVGEGSNLYFTNARSRASISENITGINYDSASGIFSMASGYVIPTQVMLDAKVPYTGATGDVNIGTYDLKTNKVFLLDEANDNYGSIHYSDGDFHIEDADGHKLLVVEDGFMQLHLTDTIQSNLFTTNLTQTRNHYLPNASGTLALTTDINYPVTSVFGRTGAVVSANGDYTTSQVTEGTNLYYTEARVNANTNVAANTAARHNAVTLGTANGLSLSTQALSLAAASTSTTGALTSTDWNTFNGKQPLITAGTTSQYYRGDKTFQTLNTTAVTEGTNLYYTDARARAAISGTLPISVTSGVVSISQAAGASNGYLSSTDWNTFNNKQAALGGTGFVKSTAGTISYDTNTYLTTISGITAGGELSGTYANPSLVNSAVTGKVLTGLNLVGGGTIADTDSILGAFGKVQNQISALVGGVMYEGTWNASTNTPTIVSSVGSKGDYYIVATAGSTNINGITTWSVGDWIIFNGTTWDKVDNTDAVSSVNGYTGAVSLVTNDIVESTNLYFTNARAIGSTLTGYTSGAGVVAATDTILQAIQKLNGNVSGLVTGVSSVFGRTGAVVAASGDYTTTQVTEGTNLYYTATRFNTAFSGKTTTDLSEGTNLYYTEARVNANTNVAANTAARHNAVTIGTANGLSLSTQALSLAAANTTTTGALTSTDWNTFNGKQAALSGTGFVKISGTTISYDNSTYLTTSAASSTYLPLAGGTLTGALGGTSASFSSTLDAVNTSTLTGVQPNNIINYTDATSYGRFYFTEGANYKGTIQFIGSNFVTTARRNNLEIINSTTGDLAMGTGDARTFFIKNGGNVGIGTSSPGAKLDVTGAVRSSTYCEAYDGTRDIYLNSAADFGLGALPAIQVASNHGLQFATNNSLKMIIQSGGNVGIGNNTPSYILDVANGSSPSIRVRNAALGGTATLLLETANNFSGTCQAFIKCLGSVGNGTSILTFGTAGSSGDATATERMRIRGNGSITLNNNDFGTNYQFSFKAASGGIDNFGALSVAANGDNIINFFNGASSYVASISIGASLVTYGVGSDYRLKEDFKDFNGLEKLQAIKVYDFKYKRDGDRMEGVIAHELQEVIPYAVTGFKDEMNQDGTEKIQNVDYSKIVPVLIKAIQEQQAQIEELKAKILSL